MEPKETSLRSRFNALSTIGTIAALSLFELPRIKAAENPASPSNPLHFSVARSPRGLPASVIEIRDLMIPDEKAANGLYHAVTMNSIVAKLKERPELRHALDAFVNPSRFEWILPKESVLFGNDSTFSTPALYLKWSADSLRHEANDGTFLPTPRLQETQESFLKSLKFTLGLAPSIATGDSPPGLGELFGLMTERIVDREFRRTMTMPSDPEAQLILKSASLAALNRLSLEVHGTSKSDQKGNTLLTKETANLVARASEIALLDPTRRDEFKSIFGFDVISSKQQLADALSKDPTLVRNPKLAKYIIDVINKGEGGLNDPDKPAIVGTSDLQSFQQQSPEQAISAAKEDPRLATIKPLAEKAEKLAAKGTYSEKDVEELRQLAAQTSQSDTQNLVSDVRKLIDDLKKAHNEREFLENVRRVQGSLQATAFTLENAASIVAKFDPEFAAALSRFGGGSIQMGQGVTSALSGDVGGTVSNFVGGFFQVTGLSRLFGGSNSTHILLSEIRKLRKELHEVHKDLKQGLYLIREEARQNFSLISGKLDLLTLLITENFSALALSLDGLEKRVSGIDYKVSWSARDVNRGITIDIAQFSQLSRGFFDDARLEAFPDNPTWNGEAARLNPDRVPHLLSRFAHHGINDAFSGPISGGLFTIEDAERLGTEIPGLSNELLRRPAPYLYGYLPLLFGTNGVNFAGQRVFSSPETEREILRLEESKKYMSPEAFAFWKSKGHPKPMEEKDRERFNSIESEAKARTEAALAKLYTTLNTNNFPNALANSKDFIEAATCYLRLRLRYPEHGEGTNNLLSLIAVGKGLQQANALLESKELLLHCASTHALRERDLSVAFEEFIQRSLRREHLDLNLILRTPAWDPFVLLRKPEPDTNSVEHPFVIDDIGRIRYAEIRHLPVPSLVGECRDAGIVKVDHSFRIIDPMLDPEYLSKSKLVTDFWNGVIKANPHINWKKDRDKVHRRLLERDPKYAELREWVEKRGDELRAKKKELGDCSHGIKEEVAVTFLRGPNKNERHVVHSRTLTISSPEVVKLVKAHDLLKKDSKGRTTLHHKPGAPMLFYCNSPEDIIKYWSGDFSFLDRLRAHPNHKVDGPNHNLRQLFERCSITFKNAHTLDLMEAELRRFYQEGEKKVIDDLVTEMSRVGSTFYTALSRYNVSSYALNFVMRRGWADRLAPETKDPPAPPFAGDIRAAILAGSASNSLHRAYADVSSLLTWSAENGFDSRGQIGAWDGASDAIIPAALTKSPEEPVTPNLDHTVFLLEQFLRFEEQGAVGH